MNTQQEYRFKVGDFAVFPGHGVGKICAVQIQEIVPNQISSYYVIQQKSTGPKILVPVDREDKIRKLSTKEEIEKVFQFLTIQEFKIDRSVWNRRQRDYLEKIHTGHLLEIADVFRTLKALEKLKVLCFSEKKMLSSCKNLIIDEMVLGLRLDHQSVEKKIEACFLES